ncbi:reverse transcriptase domain-containing protein, partial [Tanacetum coccineum]
LHKKERLLMDARGRKSVPMYEAMYCRAVNVLADFIAERPDEDGPPGGIQVEEAIPDPWTLFTDGSSCLKGSGVGFILMNPEGVEFTYALRFKFEASNNEAEYEALIAGLRIAK